MPHNEVDLSRLKLISVADYECLIGAEQVDRILSKARRLSDLRIVNISSTYYGGAWPKWSRH